MTVERKAAIAGGTLWIAIAFNAGVFVWNVVTGFSGLAVVQSIVLVALTAWLAISPKIHAFWEARCKGAEAKCKHAEAQARMAELGLQVMEDQMRSGRVQVDLVGQVKSAGGRMN